MVPDDGTLQASVNVNNLQRFVWFNMDEEFTMTRPSKTRLPSLLHILLGYNRCNNGNVLLFM